MVKDITRHEAGFSVVIRVTDECEVRLLHCSSLPYDPTTISEERVGLFRLVELQLAGENHNGHHGSKHTGTVPGERLRYLSHQEERTQYGRKWEIVQQDELSGLCVSSHLQFFDGLPVVRAWSEVVNLGEQTLTLEYLSSFALTGLAKVGQEAWDQKMQLSFPYSTCFGEGQWRTYSLPAVGLSQVSYFSTRRFHCTSIGTWSTGQFLPLGYLENQESGEAWMWQIEHNGSWHWELSDQVDQLYLQLSGPTDQEHQWYQQLTPGASFTSVPVAICTARRSFDQAAAGLTRYRRLIRRPNRDNSELPVIFNDYMNCLMGDPTEEKLSPLIERAAEAGCEYFCIDAGWFTDDYWWDTLGVWEPSQRRFPGGLQATLRHIRERGMVPGLWVEIEVMGVKCPLAQEWPDACFFMLHGKRVVQHGRYQLDFRHSRVVAHADEAFDRLVQQYGIGYIKIDYNINAGVGTEYAADSPGAGLLAHNRAYLAWLDRVFARYPDLVIENCGSGGMRMDYALMQRHSIQSSSDQNNYRLYPPIATGCLSALPPEQCAVWSYPLASDNLEGVAFNMINALLMRIHLSGEIAQLSNEQFALVKAGIRVYTEIRADIARGIPFWPLGLPTFQSSWVCLGLHCDESNYLAVWHRTGGEEHCQIVLPAWIKGDLTAQASCLYPRDEPGEWSWDAEQGVLNVTLAGSYSARLFRVKTL